MLIQKNDIHPNILDVAVCEFNGHDIYGIEFILDEFMDRKETNKVIKNDPVNYDWFGLSDLGVYLD